MSNAREISSIFKQYKARVRVASVANIAVLSGLLTIDDVPLVAGDRVLLKDQSSSSLNGIYIADIGAWVRSKDAYTGAEFNGGAIIPVEEGTVNADTNWQITNNGTVTIGTTGLTFQVISSPVTASSDPTFVDNSNSAASTSWIRGAMGAIATAAGFSYSFTANGYFKFPSWLAGFIFQWGGTTSDHDHNGTTVNRQAMTFPIAFTSVALKVIPFVEERANASGAGSTVTAAYRDLTLTGFTHVTTEYASVVQSIRIHYFAFGK